MGGGTTLVEAATLGRRALGTDISSLAAFVAQVKTTVYDEDDICLLRVWADGLPELINMQRFAIYPAEWVGQGYLRHLDTTATWRITKAVQQALASAFRLSPQKLEDFARCVTLRTAQWALDARKKIPSVREFRSRMRESAYEMLDGAEEYHRAVQAAFPEGEIYEPICIQRSASGLEDEPRLQSLPRPRLILTSPPYPGVHMLYHRWQVDGRKETPAAFWIANRLDGAGETHYTMGNRKEIKLRSYYENLSEAYRSIRQICDHSTTIVQMVAFADPDWQLPRYLQVMGASGFEEFLLPGIDDSDDGRLWRSVPNRKWHADQMGETPGSREVVLIHAPAPITQPLQHSPTDTPCPRLGH